MRALGFALLLSGCIDLPHGEAPEDAEVVDAKMEVGARDAGRDAARPDARMDAGGRDAATDARMDAGIDAAVDAMIEASVDASLDAMVAAPRVLIVEVRTRGPNGANDELVEIVNAGTYALDVSAFKLRAESATGTIGTRAVVPEGIVLAPGESLLFANSGASGYAGTVRPDVTYTFGLADGCGVAIADPSGNVLDALGTLETAMLVEGTPRTPLTENVDASHARRIVEGGYVDTGDNAADFETLAPSMPRGRESTQ